MLKTATVFLCFLSLAHAEEDSTNVCECPNAVHNDDAFTYIYPVSDSYLTFGENTKKPDVEDGESESNRDRRSLIPVRIVSAFTPRLGRRDQDDSKLVDVDRRAHVIRINAGSTFTPRLGRKSYY